MLTTAEAARKLNLARRTVQKWCVELGFTKQGRDYLLDEEQVEQIRIVAQGAPGRPKKS